MNIFYGQKCFCSIKKFLYYSLLVLFLTFYGFSQKVNAQTYDFSSIPVGGGGYITGLEFHPTEKDHIVIRTDVGGAYRWNGNDEKWEQLLYAQAIYGNVDGMAVAPSDANIIYVAGGDATEATDPYAVLKSNDGGLTWSNTNFMADVPFQGNQRDVRYTGERVGIHPLNSDVVFVGTKKDGLFYTLDGGQTWQRHPDVPKNAIITERLEGENIVKTGYVGVRAIAFDASTGLGGAIPKLYVAEYETGLYQSTDGGKTLQLMPASPKTIRRLKVAVDGTLWATTQKSLDGAYGGKVYHYVSGNWEDKTPEAQVWKPYNALAVHPEDANKVIAVLGSENAESPLYKSVDAGLTWTKIHYTKNNITRIIQPWKEAWQFATGPSAIAVNSNAPNEVWMTSGEAVYVSTNFWSAGTQENPVHFETKVDGIEELVTFCSAAPQSGEAKLFVGHADADGFRYVDLDSPAQDKFLNPNFQETTSIAYVFDNPDHLVRVGGWSWGSRGTGSYSTDNGKTWTEMENFPTKEGTEYGLGDGLIAVSKNNLDHSVVVPMWTHPHYTKDRGRTWQPSKIDGQPSGVTGIMKEIWQRDVLLQADTQNPDLFYLADRETGKFYRSTDGGVSFTKISSFKSSAWREWVKVRPMPDNEGEVWLGSKVVGLMKSTDAGTTWTTLKGVTQVSDFAFGKPKPGTTVKTLFVAGTVDGIVGLFESNDLGQTFNRINGEIAFGKGIGVATMSASLRDYGEVYLGTGGWGYFKGIKK